MKNAFTLLKSKTAKAAAVVTGALASTATFAQETGISSAISAAETEGVSSVTLAVGAVIAVAAVAMGFSIIRGIISR
ncbi:hypothetical protein [Gilvimarinus sp. DA14]|uniref:hypothetical protein n=1 Tax=Gilvimarinus sp. DA14 TaxID=2956798 RepID=UPI0020B78470|nr:hypothetical protein [Gilvimarinus sp. DA14]UTF61281.1 hypothetical protein NHM04_05635 [Gilvimarinus sp. DA14]